jgi:hypothetical protein
VQLHLDDAWILMQLIVGRRLKGSEVMGVSEPFRPIAIRLAGAPVGNRGAIWATFLEGRLAEDPVTLADADDPDELDAPGRAPAWFRGWYSDGLIRPRPGKSGYSEFKARYLGSARDDGERNGRAGCQAPEPARDGS